MSQVTPAAVPFPAPTGIPRCPFCGALTPPSSVGTAAQWCSLCLAPLQWARAELPDPVDAPLPAPEVVAVDPANFDQIDQMLTAIKEQDNDPWVARSYRFSTRGQKIALGLGIGVGLVVLAMVASFVVGYFLG